MIVHSEIKLSDIQNLEQARGANSRLGHYEMDKYCKLEEFRHYKVTLETLDNQRLFLLGEFASRTIEGTGRLIDILFEQLEENSQSRVNRVFDPDAASGLHPMVLKNNFDFAIICVTPDIHAGSLTIIDGNHRSIAFFRKHGDLAGLPAIVCEHRNICQWPFVPKLARVQ